MGEPSLRDLENDVEAARFKLARDLSTLRSPETYSQFTSTLKQEALTAKDELLDKAKSSVQSTVESLVEDLKAKAAANPTAALAIGAGIAWRLIQRPPITTALVGAGLFSLLRTESRPANGRSNSDYLGEAKARLREQASDFATDVKEQAGRAAKVVSAQVGELAAAAQERAGEAIQAAGVQVNDVASAAKGRVRDWGDQATSSLREAAGQFKEKAASVTERAGDQLNELRESVVRATDNTGIVPRIEALSTSVESVVADRQTRDTFLLGAASVAVIAALGIACQKKIAQSESGG